MLKSIEVQGRTEDEAIELALEQLGLSRDDVSVEILETAKSGLFGLKNTPAIVKVEYESDGADDTAPSAAAETVSKPKSSSSSAAKKAAISPDTKSDDSISGEISGELKDRLETYLKGLFERMELNVSFDIAKKDGSVSVTLRASDPGVLIGRRGETLDALQHLTNYSVNRTASGRVRIHLDAENYRQRRSEALINLASRTAGKVIKYRRNMTLDPMNAYERHVIHAALQDNEQVSTFSVGNETSRRVVIAYGKDKAAPENDSSPHFKEWH